MSTPPVSTERSAGVVTVTLNQPDRQNALSASIIGGLHDALDDLGQARCVVVTGAGDTFSAGGDLDSIRERQTADRPLNQKVREMENKSSRLLRRLVDLPTPTVAKINGPAVGLGANLAIACDIQLLREDAGISFAFRQIGLCIDGGTSYLLPRLVGVNVAKEIVMTGEYVTGERAREIGLVNRVLPAEGFEERVSELIEPIATGPTIALEHSNRLIDRGAAGVSLREALEAEYVSQGICLESEDHAEGLDAFEASRDPDFSGR